MGQPPGGTAFRGRDAELGYLDAALRAARTTGAAAVLLGGEAGVGKSRLIAEFGARAAEQGTTVLAGRALDLGDGPSFWPVVSALREYVRSGAGPRVDALAAGLERLEEPTAAGSRVEMLEALHRLIAQAAAGGPVVLVVDDLHWADRSTRDLFVYLVASLAAEPVLLIGSYREDARGGVPGRLSAMTAELGRHRQVSFHRVAPLPRTELSALLAGWAPHRPDLEPLVWRHSGGNVFLAEQTVRAVLAGDPRGLPATVRDLVRAGVEALSPSARWVVRAVAAGVGDVPHALLGEVLARLSDELPDAVREAVECGFVVVDPSGDGYRLRHGLMVEAVVADLLPGERVELHGRYARALSTGPGRDRPGAAACLAHHWERADDPVRALPATLDAAAEAEQLRGYAEAYRHWLRAAALTARVPVGSVTVAREACLERAAEAADLAGDHDEAVALLAQRLADPDGPVGLEAAVLRGRLGRCLVSAGRAGEAEQAYRRAVDALPAVPEPGTGPEPDPGGTEPGGADAVTAAAADVLAGHAAVLLHVAEFAAARRVARQALGPARRTGDPRVLARVLATYGFSSAYLDDADAGLRALAEAVGVAERDGDPATVGECLLRQAELLCGPLGAFTEGVEAARRGSARMQERGLGRTSGAALLVLAANALFRLGRWDEAEEVVAQAWGLAPSGAQAIEVRLARARLRMGRGDLAGSEDDLEAVELVAGSAVGPRLRLPLLILRAGLEMWRGRPGVAFGHVVTGLDVVESGIDDFWAVAPLLWHGARAHAQSVEAGAPPPLPEIRRLRGYYRELAERAQGSVPAVRAVLETFSAMCAAEDARARERPDPAAWAGVADRMDTLHQPYPAAYARLRAAEAHLARRTRSAEGAAELARAERAARALRAGPLLAEIENLAGRARVTFDRPPAGDGATGTGTATAPSGPLGSLTVRELEVLTEVSGGLTNKEIAARLFISEKTVGVHLTRIFAKLGVRTRVQASNVLQAPTRSHPQRSGSGGE